MSANVPHIAVDRIVPVFLGRDMEFVLARVQTNPPARFLVINDEDETHSSDVGKPTMEIVGRIRLGTEEAAEIAMGILSLLATTQEVDLDELEKFMRLLRDKAERTSSQAGDGEDKA